MLLEMSVSNWIATPCRVSSPTCRSTCGPAQARINKPTARARKAGSRRSQRCRSDGGTSRQTANPEISIAE